MNKVSQELKEKYAPHAKQQRRLEKSGDWYHCLTEFPGVLFDGNGFIIFETEESYLSNPNLRHKPETNTLTVPGGIKSLHDYKTFDSVK